MDEAQSARIEQLYEEMYDRLLVYAECVLDLPLAEEAVQETFRIACQNPEALLSSENPRGWLLLTLKHIIHNLLRRQDTASRFMDGYLSGQAQALSTDQEPLPPELLYANISGTEEFRLLSEMAIDGRTHAEMADSRGISVNACKKRVQRAKALLKQRIRR
jgi:RNA polymerase sigma-70 factor (ECF subfamily)